MHALFGRLYTEKPPKEVKPIIGALEQGFYECPASGKRVYRINSISQAQQILGHKWTDESWGESSVLANQFRITPSASVAVMGDNDQRLVFFDQSNQLVAVYPRSD